MYIQEYIEGEKYYALVNIAIKDNLKSEVGGNLENFGYITINSIQTSDNFNEVFYDNLEFFFNNKLKLINKEVKSDFKDKLLMREVKRFLLRMRKKGYLK